jgi:hypothetical protein
MFVLVMVYDNESPLKGDCPISNEMMPLSNVHR